MLAAWRREGVGTRLVLRCPGMMPGLYVIQTDPTGERRFLYWRDSAAARRLFALPETKRIVAALATCRLVYYSGISLSLYGEDGRARLAEALRAARAGGASIAFDTNFRPRGWPDRTLAQEAFRRALAGADLVFASVDDLEPLFGATWEGELAGAAPQAEVVVKLREPRCTVRCGAAAPITVAAGPVAEVVDTTAAGITVRSGNSSARMRRMPLARSSWPR